MRYPNARILIFAKAPEPGAVKTRLIPALGAVGAVELYLRLLEETVERVANAALCPLQLWCAPDNGHPVFRKLASRHALSLHRQVGVDLGGRMCHAAGEALKEAEAVVLIGTDCPLMGEVQLKQALQWLEEGSDAVLGPAEDGGYVLFGLRHSEPALFKDVPWGGAQVLAQTRGRLQALGWRWRELETLWDLDRPSDLVRLGSLESPPGDQ